jgi:hypothetical protein
MNSDEITINGEVYVKKTAVAKDTNGKKYQIVRTLSAGVFAGYIDAQEGQTVIMSKARRLWYWEGAASLSQLAMEGVKSPDKCKFPIEVERVELLQVIEILDVTESAKNSIGSVKVWQK